MYRPKYLLMPTTERVLVFYFHLLTPWKGGTEYCSSMGGVLALLSGWGEGAPWMDQVSVRGIFSKKSLWLFFFSRATVGHFNIQNTFFPSYFGKEKFLV